MIFFKKSYSCFYHYDVNLRVLKAQLWKKNPVWKRTPNPENNLIWDKPADEYTVRPQQYTRAYTLFPYTRCQIASGVENVISESASFTYYSLTRFDCPLKTEHLSISVFRVCIQDII
jgi:hypothetical protein